NNMGGNIGVPFDILGNPRTLNAPDPGAYEYDLVGLDAGIAWVSPVSPVSAGNQTITVSITNNLSNTVNSVELAYTDGGTPVTETFTGLGLTSANSVNLSFTVPYNMVSNTSLKAYIISVNGGVDDIQADDTTSVQNLCISLAGNYTIDAGSAASATNFQNFTALANALNCGGVSGPVTVNVVAGSGPYNEQVTFNQAIGSSAVNTITINGNGNTLNFTPTTEYFTLRLNGADYFNFNNLNVTGTGANVITTILTNNANYNNFTACTFTVPSSNTATSNSAVAFTSSTTTATSGASNGNNNVFDGCTMSGGYYCVSVYGASGATNQGNQFLNCTITEYYVYGFYHIYGNGTLVQGCTLERPTRASVSTGYGIVITTGSSNCLVQNNRVRKLFGGIPTSTSTCYLLYCTAAASAGNENKFINNLASNIESNGAIYGLYFSGASYIQAYHNTISLDHTASTGTGVTYGLYSSTATGTDYRDNIISITRGGTGTKYCAYYATLLPTNTNYNNHYMNAAAGTNYFAYDGVSATSYATLAAWQGAHPTLDMQTVSIDPVYTDPSLQNYSPSNFLLDNLGTNAGVAADILGNPRSATTP
ncbi:MAG TPA: hypothetical protein PLP14_09570, partial [Chitinophagaceae bacterium]|nr:hypothetical protein [Chitinophagaceae bacterium]